MAGALDRHLGRPGVWSHGHTRGPDGPQLKAKVQDEGIPQGGEGRLLIRFQRVILFCIKNQMVFRQNTGLM